MSGILSELLERLRLSLNDLGDLIFKKKVPSSSEDRANLTSAGSGWKKDDNDDGIGAGV